MVDIDVEVERLLAEEAAQRRADLAARVQERRDREQAQQQVQGTLESLEARLQQQFDAKALAKLRTQAEDALLAYAAAMVGWNTALEDIRDDLAEAGLLQHPNVDSGSYDIGRGLRIERTIVRRQRLQTEIASIAREAVSRNVGRGQWSLDAPKD